VVTQFLKMAQLVDQHGMSEVQVGRGGVKAGFDSERPAGFQFLDKFCLDQQFIGTTPYQRKL
jgi:hypothetical protein